MSKLHDLIGKVENAELRAALADECRKLEKGKRFGLVFEEHLPEATPIPGAAIKVGATVATKAQDGGALFRVVSIEGDVAKCTPVGGDGGAGGGLVEAALPRGGRSDGRAASMMPPPTRSARDSRAHCAEECARGVTSTTGLDAFPLADLVAVAKFGEPIYPYLEKLDELEHGGGDLWHALIQADNYHALQLLEYLYAGQVDCIYIDPPYNTGAKDWKYNNDYVDSNDCYRHSKWLSMMERRLKIAKRLLNPKDSVLIVTIDEKEYLHLGMLLEQMFPEAEVTMCTDVINPRAGVARPGAFTRTHEYVYYLQFGTAQIQPLISNEPNKNPIWFSLMRTGSNSARSDRPNLFYPIWCYPDGKLFEVGENVAIDVDKETVIAPQADVIPVWPLRPDGRENTWQLGRETLQKAFADGTARISTHADRITVNYLRTAEKKRIELGEILCKGKDANGALILEHNEAFGKRKAPDTIWSLPEHDAGLYGSSLISTILCDKRFTFPKSLYAVHDAIRFFVANKPNALILDFFAGSGTTLHAVNLLNAEDGGKRRCILVTNNEVSNDEAAAFRKRGLNPGDAEWEARGIAQYVTWPRTTCSIKGVNVKGESLKGEYITAKGGGRGATALPAGGSGEGVPMADGFKANAVFFKLGFLDPGAVSMGRRFKELLPLLWMKAGAVGKCPAWGDGGGLIEAALPAGGVSGAGGGLIEAALPAGGVSGAGGGLIEAALPAGRSDGRAVAPRPPLYRIWHENRMAVLFDEGAFAAFAREVKAQPEIATVYLITDYEPSFRAMAKSFPGRRVYQLYRDYRDNFRLNAR